MVLKIATNTYDDLGHCSYIYFDDIQQKRLEKKLPDDPVS